MSGGRRYSIEEITIRVSQTGAWIVKSRIVGIFSILIPKIHRLYQRLKSTDKLIDATNGKPMKSLIILEDGSGVLSAMNALTISKRLNDQPEEGE